MNWQGRKVLVTGGASFIGSHLVDGLVERGAQVHVVDDYSSGKPDEIMHHVQAGKIELVCEDLRNPGVAKSAVSGMDLVFHLAADHGGRGYVDTFQAGPASNMLLDGVVFWEALNAGVDKVVFASSGCVYPNFLQSNADEELYLTEDLVKPPYDADNMYGWAKLMAELTLQSYYREHGLKSASCRFFTAYGPRAKETHAVMAMTARAFLGRDPFEVWGDGTQVRNWTHVDDIVKGTILAAEKIDDGTAINVGTMERTTVLECAQHVLEMTGHRAQIKLDLDKPTGPKNRVADNSLARKLLGWAPEIPFREGLRQTIDWYYANKTQAEVAHIMDTGGTMERKVTENQVS